MTDDEKIDAMAADLGRFMLTAVVAQGDAVHREQFGEPMPSEKRLEFARKWVEIMMADPLGQNQTKH
jgi:hypothetical protein